MKVMISATSCRCGSFWAWMVQRPTGAWEMHGCICHHDPPKGIVGQVLTVEDSS